MGLLWVLAHVVGGARGQVVSTQPATGPTWGWSLLPRETGRVYSALATDWRRNRVVLFGGRDDNLGSHEGVMEWDGLAWAHVPVTSGPGLLANHVMAWDPVNQEVLLYGGGNGYGAVFETWTWNGARWRRWDVAPPSAATGWIAATDPVRRVVVMFGGYDGVTGTFLDETWEWNGAAWVQRIPAVRPFPRSIGAAAYCARSGKVVLFGGYSWAVAPNDTWEWDGLNWTRTPGSPAGPVARYSNGMCATRQGTVIMHGGQGISRLNDTWEWDGARWTQLPGQGSLPPMAINYLAEDPVNQTAVHLGWHTDQVSWQWTSHWTPTGWTRAWERVTPGYIAFACWDRRRDERVVLAAGWSGMVTWIVNASDEARQLSSGGAPPRRYGGSFVYHEADAVSVLFGGNSNQNDTWLWNGTTWTQDTRSPAPPQGQAFHCYDRQRRKMVILTWPNLDMWEYDVTGGWVARPVGQRPPPRTGYALAWSPANGHLVLHGGTDTQGAPLHDTWEFNGVGWVRMDVPGDDRYRNPTWGPMHYAATLQACVMSAWEWDSRFQRRRVAIWCYDHRSWRRLQVDESPYFSTLWGGGLLLPYDRHGELQFFWWHDLNASYLSRLRFPTVTPERPRYRPGETMSAQVWVPQGNGMFLPLWSLGIGVTDLRAAGVAVTGAASHGEVPLVPDAVFWATAGAMLVPLDVSGHGRFAWTTPASASLVGLRLHMSGVHVGSALQVDWIAGPRWIEFF